jgi:hypothetical protein
MAEWWKELGVEDPISLEPICNLAHEPFVLTSANGGQHYFDGTSLSTYILATGRFENPLTREELCRDDFERLDEFLRMYTQTSPKMVQRFNEERETARGATISDGIFTEQEQNNPFAAEQRQREASTLLLSLFSYGPGPLQSRGQIRQIENRVQAEQPEEQELFQFTIGDDPTRWDTETLVKRNKILVKALKRHLKGDPEGLNTFKADSQKLRSNEISPADYYDRFLQVADYYDAI